MKNPVSRLFTVGFTARIKSAMISMINNLFLCVEDKEGTIAITEYWTNFSKTKDNVSGIFNFTV